jgi:hypothetical protein
MIAPDFNPANPKEQTMTTVSDQFESPKGVRLSASVYAAARSAEMAMQPSSREDMEERRWQLEWERRNVED